MALSISLAASAMLGMAVAQHPGSTPDVHPKLTTWKCTTEGGCVAQDTTVVLDALAHWVHQVDAPDYGCGDWGNAPNETACPDVETCQANCVMEGVTDYSNNGISTDGGNLYLDMLRDDLTAYSPRLYLLDEAEENYELLQLVNQEFTFDVDMSKLPCGMNAALYFSEMEVDGGKSDINTGGAPWGTGYCDAQCYTTPFVNGEPNLEGYGACCNELDIWEANGRAQALAPHPCSKPGLYKCSGTECEFDGVCDKYGCGYNPYTLGNKEYYGPDGSFTIDTSRPFTVVTQFPANEEGVVQSIRRLYVQDGKVIKNSPVDISTPAENFIDDEYCEATGATRYMDIGATSVMGESLARGMVLCFSIWWDEGGFMNWLDAGAAGPCNETEGAPDVIREIQPDTSVIFSNIKWGELGSTYKPTCKSKSKKH